MDFHRDKVKNHFLRLDSDSRHSRFCSIMNDENLINYVNKMDFSKNGIFGIFNENLDIIGLGECVFYKDSPEKKETAEVAFSVEKGYQGKGLGNKLMARVVQFANTHNLKEMTMYFLRDNAATLHLANKYNFKAEYYSTEVSGTVKVPNIPPILDVFNEQIEELFANIEITQQWQHKIFTKNLNAMTKNIDTLFKIKP